MIGTLESRTSILGTSARGTSTLELLGISKGLVSASFSIALEVKGIIMDVNFFEANSDETVVWMISLIIEDGWSSTWPLQNDSSS